MNVFSLKNLKITDAYHANRDIYNKTTKDCIPCDKGEYPITFEDFDGCVDSFSQYCELYTTYCKSLENHKHEKVCEENDYNINDTFIVSNNNYKILFIN